VIPKTLNEARMAENIDLFNFKLSETEMAAISALDRNKRYNCPSSYFSHFFCPIFD
jgi:D-xylose reductase